MFSERILLDDWLAVWVVGRICEALWHASGLNSDAIYLGGIAWFGADEGLHAGNPVGPVIELLYTPYVSSSIACEYSWLRLWN